MDCIWRGRYFPSLTTHLASIASILSWKHDRQRIGHKYHIDSTLIGHDDIIKWKHFPRYWPFVRGIHRSPVNSPHKGQWHGALMFSLICFWINGWVNNREAGDLRRYRAHYDVTVMACLTRALWDREFNALVLDSQLELGSCWSISQVFFVRFEDFVPINSSPLLLIWI